MVNNSNSSNNKLSDILKEGDVLGVKMFYESEWISDVIEEINDEQNILEIKILEHFIEENLMVEDIIQCRIVVNDIVYVFEGKVHDIGILKSDRVMIEITNIMQYKNERQSKRYTVNLRGRLIYDNHENSTFVTVKNISETGVSVVSRECIGINEEVDVDIVLWKEQVLSIEGKIVRMFKVGKNYKYGIVIEHIDDKSRKLLHELIEELESLEQERQFK